MVLMVDRQFPWKKNRAQLVAVVLDLSSLSQMISVAANASKINAFLAIPHMKSVRHGQATINAQHSSARCLEINLLCRALSQLVPMLAIVQKNHDILKIAVNGVTNKFKIKVSPSYHGFDNKKFPFPALILMVLLNICVFHFQNNVLQFH